MTLGLHLHWPVRESQISEKEPFMWQWQAAEEEEGEVSVFPEAKSNSQMFTVQLLLPWEMPSVG